MTRRKCLGCRRQLTEPSSRGGRPQRFCSERCRSRWRRFGEALARGRDQRDQRLETTGEERYRLRSQAYTVASTARRMAAVLDEEEKHEDWRQPAWDRPRPGRPATYTAAALELLDAAR
ncbi:hypothetical protein [Streptomyces sp. NPDC058572]|uniref:hypothetical protein n=1 Tax=Streptomyces sp. NPDC058572 TaxID=3346546 RepID=UPI003664193F